MFLLLSKSWNLLEWCNFCPSASFNLEQEWTLASRITSYIFGHGDIVVSYKTYSSQLICREFFNVIPQRSLELMPLERGSNLPQLSRRFGDLDLSIWTIFNRCYYLCQYAYIYQLHLKMMDTSCKYIIVVTDWIMSPQFGTSQ